MHISETVFRRCVVVSRRILSIREIRYIVQLIRHPEPGSEFEGRTRHLQRLPAWLLIIILLVLGYDGMLGYVRGKIVAHLFWQKRRDPDRREMWNFHAFAMWVEESLRGRDAASQLGCLFIEHAYRRRKVRAVRLGQRGGVGREAIEYLRHRDMTVGDVIKAYSIGSDNWVYFWEK